MSSFVEGVFKTLSSDRVTGIRKYLIKSYKGFVAAKTF